MSKSKTTMAQGPIESATDKLNQMIGDVREAQRRVEIVANRLFGDQPGPDGGKVEPPSLGQIQNLHTSCDGLYVVIRELHEGLNRLNEI